MMKGNTRLAGPSGRFAATLAALGLGLLGAALWASPGGRVADAAPLAQATAVPAPVTPVPVGGKIAAEKACYVRLPDLPGPRFGMFGAINPQTGVLVAGGGTQKISEENTIAFYQLYAMKLNSAMSRWNEVPYASNEGYTREIKKGCREPQSVQISSGLAFSVLGKTGCDHGRFDPVNRAGSDIQSLRIGDTADAAGVSWETHSGIAAFVDQLTTNAGALVQHFATWDSHRGRLIFGQGTFNAKRETLGQDEVYAGMPEGRLIQLQKLDPLGPIPERRWGSCGQYIYDEATGVDGVLVVGGVEGGPPNTGLRNFNQVWWLDFSKRVNGEWKNITGRFTNQADVNFRWDAACGYDTEAKAFYTLMGRASAAIPDGATHSAGMWRVNLAQLGDPAATFTWERLAKDNLPGIRGRRGIPNVWDPVGKRFFVLGGRSGLNEYQDAWAIYPDVTGDACQALDPMAAPAGQPTATPGAVMPTPDPGAPKVCPQIATRVDAGLIAAALANPGSVPGWQDLANPSKPAGPGNPAKTWLTLQNAFARHHPIFNSLVFRAGCP